MDILGLMAVLSFGLTCFGIGYSIGKDNNKTQKQPPTSSKLSGYFAKNCWANRLSVAPFIQICYHRLSNLSKIYWQESFAFLSLLSVSAMVFEEDEPMLGAVSEQLFNMLLSDTLLPG